MDRKSIIILILCVGLWVSWGPLCRILYPPIPVPATAVTATGETNAAAPGTNAVTTAVGTNQPVIIASSTPAPKFVVRTNVPEELVSVTNENARYVFTSRGGGLREVQLLKYSETVAARGKKNQTTNEPATLNAPTAAPVFAMIGDESLQGDGVFKLTPTPNGMRAEKTLTNGLTLIKDFQLSTNYLVTVTIRWQNGSKQPLALPGLSWAAGAATPMGPQDNGQVEMVLWHDGAKSANVALGYFDTNTTKFWGLMNRTALTEYRAGSSNVFWASAQNQFFTLATMTSPTNPAAAIVVHMIDLPGPSAEEIASNPRTVLNPKGLEVLLQYPGQTLAPGQISESQFNLFAGPKEYETLAKVSARFNNDIDLVMNFGWFGGISKALLITMNWLYAHVVASYGWIIIIITVVIKSVFWPLTRASTRSMKRMQALQPQLKALQEKYKDDPQKFSAKQWEFYKKNKVNPLGGCLPMLLQMPVFFGLLSMLRNAIELRGAQFLWISDLSKPDTIFVLPFLPGHSVPLNPMPLIMGASQFWLASLTPPSPSMDPAQQKMMKYMPLMVLVFMYNFSSGLALYWTVSNLLSVLQTKLTKTQPATVTPAAAVSVAPQKKKK